MNDNHQEQNENEILKARIQELEATLKEHTAGWQRALADYQNLKRRSEEEQKAFVDMTKRQMLAGLLPIYDLLKRATDSTPDASHVTSWVAGVKQVVGEWKNLLTRWQVAPILTEAVLFDPALHEAVSMDENAEAGTVVKELEGGYTLGGSLVRPAKVVVGSREPEGNKKK